MKTHLKHPTPRVEEIGKKRELMKGLKNLKFYMFQRMVTLSAELKPG